MRKPDENHRRRLRLLCWPETRPTYVVSWSIDDSGDVYLSGRLPLAAISAEEIDRVLGAVLSNADSHFDPLLKLGFGGSIRREWAWRVKKRRVPAQPRRVPGIHRRDPGTSGHFGTTRTPGVSWDGSSVMTGLVIGARFNGPPSTGNGGFTAGRLAAYFPYGTAVRVTLRNPPPLDVTMTVDDTASDGLQLMDGETLVAEAIAVDPRELGDAVPAVDGDTRRRSDDPVRRPDLGNPFPTCFVCGPQRHLGRRPRRSTPARSTRVTCRARPPVFTPRTDLAQNVIGTGPAAIIGPEIVWSALDCPGGWALGLPGRPAVLGRMTAEVKAMPTIGERCVVVGQLDGRDGRKGFTRATCLRGRRARTGPRTGSVDRDRQ